VPVKIRDLESPFVELRDVRKSYGSTAVLNGVDLAVGRSEVACIIGPSGSGKSTVLRCINALTRVDGGSVRVGDTRVDDPRVDTQALHRRVGIVFQGYNLFPHRTVLQNVMMAPIQVLRRERGEVEAQARALLAKVHLAGKENAYPGELSGGQQQRVAIARSLCMQPEVMLFDEVTAALDPETVKEVLGVIQEIAADGMTCLLVTHEMRFAREAADYLYFMDQGRVVEHGVAREVFAAPADARTRAFLDKVL